jgi:iron complex outermembrane receptor protein
MIFRFPHKLRRLVLGAFCSATAMAGGAVAQETPVTPPADSSAQAGSAGEGLAEVVVTAQRRSQNIQNVPVSVAVVSADLIKTEGFNNATDIGTFVPSVTFETGNSADGNTINIRGIGTTGSNFGFEQAVPTFLDGIDHGHSEQLLLPFFDVDRIEILKGPQPVFFGQNATAGAVSIVSRKPGDTWSGDFDGELANFNSQVVGFGVGGPITETLGIRFAGKFTHSDGYADINSGGEGPWSNTQSGRVTLVWHPTANFDVTGKVELSSYNGAGIPQQYVGCAPSIHTACGLLLAGANHTTSTSIVEDNTINQNYGTGTFLAPPPGLDQGFTIGPPSMNLTQCTQCNDFQKWIHTVDGLVEANYHFNGGGPTLTSLSGYSYLSRDFFEDNDASPFDLSNLNRGEAPRQLSEEVRLTSQTGGFFEWMFGGYYEGIHNPTFSNSYSASATGAFSKPIGNITDESDRWASGFFAITFNVDKVSLDLGGRYTDVQKSAWVDGQVANYILAGGGKQVADATVIGVTPWELGAPSPANPHNITVTGNYRDSDFNPQAVLRYRPTDDISFYLKYATAFTAGGFQYGTAQVESPGASFEFGAEHAKSYEAGMKSVWFDRRLSVDLTIFQETFTGLQESTLNPTTNTNIVENVGVARSRGVELESHARVTPQLDLSLSMTALDGRILSYPNAACNVTEIETRTCPDTANNTISRAGQKLTFAPDWSGTLGASYWVPVSAYRVTFGGDFSLTTSYLTDDNFDPDVHMPTSTHVNLRVLFGAPDDKWNVGVFGRNLTDAQQRFYGVPTNAGSNVQKYAVLPGTSYGVQGSYKF